ncbi:hypothetical protein S922_23060 [Salmonella enterica subsp. enterica]|nr:hypothetical protein [Salmonella enterica subsp. enterica]EAW9774290.1 hypothetical protein [Salmonella enterica]
MARPKAAIDLAQVEALATQGLSDQQISDALGISLSTLKRQKKANEPFWTALKKGKAKGVAAIANKLFTKAQAGDTTAIIFFLKTRGGFLEAGAFDEEKRLLELRRLELANERAELENKNLREGGKEGHFVVVHHALQIPGAVQPVQENGEDGD